MKVSFISLFPDAVLGSVRFSILSRAEEAGLVEFEAINPRDFAMDQHRTVDDTPYGGGAGMVLKPDILGAAIESASPVGGCVIMTDPAGSLFRHEDAVELALEKRLIIVCGHYEGVDERVAEKYEAKRFSVGDYVLTGGELAAAVMADAIVRQLPGVLGSPDSLEQDAFVDGLLTYPQYTRPADWNGIHVPDVLLSGNHGEIAAWRRKQRLLTTRRRRPDLFSKAPLSKLDLELLQ
ncbi:MAG TPA: tRNA (guanosine(37)-N1)-methyltransferase TrmD [Fimbriimonadales bacterium]|jgi:tRNA (guanine37-N1)-methyltransferase|nr:tRNA (guanosine(37)-N1)-methyltransferase TrmD [Fimbriimonadales bacterium]